MAPIAADLQLDVYDIERRGGTVRITLDTPPGSESGITRDSLSLATRLITRELDHEDPIARLFVRLFRSLDALWGHDDVARTWLASESLALAARPRDLVPSIEGLVRVVGYLDAARGRV